MNIKQEAKKFKVQVKLDECGDAIIPGRFGHIYAHSDLLFGWCLMNKPDAKLKSSVLRRYVKRGLAELYAEGDTEAIFLFNPENETVFRDFLRRCGVKKKGPRSPTSPGQESMIGAPTPGNSH